MLTQFPSLARQYFNGWVKVARFTSYFRALWRKVVLANILGGLSSGLQLIVPVASMVLINDVLPKKDVKLLIWVSVILGLATIGAIAASFLEFYIATIYRERAGIILGLKLFEHIQSQPYLFFKNNESGYIMSHITNDANAALEVTSFMTGIGRSVVCLLSALVHRCCPGLSCSIVLAQSANERRICDCIREGRPLIT
jgi:ATP-binding cassette subfamily B protein